ncbi:hypothetical protein M5K25_002938 [Dendrobium thyrsiflorum]|uniref:Uncharacterized protein n=1 Tax=Dendrobium thyrsiflorum TaxID=117978 RepID=A0ABD0VNK4_DENTH
MRRARRASGCRRAPAGAGGRVRSGRGRDCGARAQRGIYAKDLEVKVFPSPDFTQYAARIFFFALN